MNALYLLSQMPYVIFVEFASLRTRAYDGHSPGMSSIFYSNEKLAKRTEESKNYEAYTALCKHTSRMPL